MDTLTSVEASRFQDPDILADEVAHGHHEAGAL